MYLNGIKHNVVTKLNPLTRNKDGQTDRWTDKGHFYNPLSASRLGIKYRPIINLKPLNSFVQYEHFKQETFSIMLDLIQENDFFTSIDLQDAYFAVPIHKESF